MLDCGAVAVTGIASVVCVARVSPVWIVALGAVGEASVLVGDVSGAVLIVAFESGEAGAIIIVGATTRPADATGSAEIDADATGAGATVSASLGVVAATLAGGAAGTTFAVSNAVARPTPTIPLRMLPANSPRKNPPRGNFSLLAINLVSKNSFLPFPSA